MRWNRSRWVPRAWATAALIGSAWETATTTSPGCARAQPGDAASADAGLHLGERLAAGEAEAARVALHRLPLGELHQLLQLAAGPLAEVALEQAPGRSATFSPRAVAMGAAVSRVRSSGEAYTASTVFSSAMRCGDRLGLRAGPSSARCRPGRPAGQRACRSWGSGRGGRAGRVVGGGGLGARAWSGVNLPSAVPIVAGPTVASPVLGRRSLAGSSAEIVGLPGLPAAGGVAGAGGRREAGRLPRTRTYWGRPRARLRRPRGRGSWWSVWRRPRTAANRTGRMFTGDRSGDWLYARAAPRRAGQPARRARPRTTASAHRRLHHRAGPLRAAGQQAHAGRARPLPALPRAGAGAAGRARGSYVRARRVRLRGAEPR